MGLPLLRTLVLIGLLVVYLQPRWRSEREEHLDSRVLMLVDTSLSMAASTRRPAARQAQPRLQQVAAALDDTEFLARLRKKHHVTVVPFNSVLEKDRRVVLPMEAGNAGEAGDSDSRQCSPAHSVCRWQRHARACRIICPHWRKHLVPGGTDTRLGEALEQLLREERSTPVSGIVLVSDGGLNAGASPDTAHGTRPRVAHPHLHRRRRLGEEARRRPRGRIQRSLAGLSRRSLSRWKVRSRATA